MNKNNNIIAIHNVYLSTYNDDVVNLKILSILISLFKKYVGLFRYLFF